MSTRIQKIISFFVIIISFILLCLLFVTPIMDYLVDANNPQSLKVFYYLDYFPYGNFYGLFFVFSFIFISLPVSYLADKKVFRYVGSSIQLLGSAILFYHAFTIIDFINKENKGLNVTNAYMPREGLYFLIVFAVILVLSALVTLVFSILSKDEVKISKTEYLSNKIKELKEKRTSKAISEEEYKAQLNELLNK